MMQGSRVSIVFLFASTVALFGTEPPAETPASGELFARLDTDGDGKLTLQEAPEQGKMLIEFLLMQSGKGPSAPLDREEFRRLAQLRLDRRPGDAAAAVAALGTAGEVRRAPESCPACAMGLTAEFVFKRLDVNGDRSITVAEFQRSPGMQDPAKAREVVERLDQNGDVELSWAELEAAYLARHADCKRPDPAVIAADAAQAGPDGRGDGGRFAQVFILRSDQDGDGRISEKEFRGPSFGFERLDKNKNGFIERDELGDLHRRRRDDPKSMRERLESGDVPQPPREKKPPGLGVGGERK